MELNGKAMKKFFLCKLCLIVFGALLAVQSVQADLAKALNCNNDDVPEVCQGLLIGTIDSLDAIGAYCPDGNTSYGYIIESWKRWVANNSHLSDAPTLLQMRQVLRELKLACGK